MWDIYPLDLGTAQLKLSLLRADKPQDGQETVQAPSVAWLLVDQQSGEQVLVDTGPAPDEQWGRLYHNQYLRRDDQQLAAQLALYGSTPDDISRVLLTHLHWDHGYGAIALERAQVIVQARELAYASAPRPEDRRKYEADLGQPPFFYRYRERMILAEGDTTLGEGLWVVLLAGHTPGSQGVLVESSLGRVLIAGDLINTFANWQDQVPCGLYTDLSDCYASLAKIKGLEAIVLPSHDSSIFDYIACLKKQRALP